jgi:hypothetical protein
MLASSHLILHGPQTKTHRHPDPILGESQRHKPSRGHRRLQGAKLLGRKCASFTPFNAVAGHPRPRLIGSNLFRTLPHSSFDYPLFNRKGAGPLKGPEIKAQGTGFA